MSLFGATEAPVSVVVVVIVVVDAAMAWLLRMAANGNNARRWDENALAKEEEEQWKKSKPIARMALRCIITCALRNELVEFCVRISLTG